jgi:hypothetical protein
LGDYDKPVVTGVSGLGIVLVHSALLSQKCKMHQDRLLVKNDRKVYHKKANLSIPL